MKKCPKCNIAYDDSLNFCVKCGARLLEISAQNNAKQGLVINQPIVERPKTVVKVTPTIPQKVVKYIPPEDEGPTFYEKLQLFFENKKNKQKVFGGLAALMLFCIAVFLYVGPTEYHVARLTASNDIGGLMQMIDERAYSASFQDITREATRSIIAIGNKNEINMLAEELKNTNWNPSQQKAIIAAFTEKKMLAPDFFDVFVHNKNIRTNLKENGLAFDSNIFKNKIMGDMNEILVSCRKEPRSYKQRIDMLHELNADSSVPDEAFKNLLAVTDIYSIQKYVGENDSAGLLQLLETFKNKPDIPLLAQNTKIFSEIENEINKEKSANSEIKELNQKLNDLHTTQNIDREKLAMGPAQQRLNNTRRIWYWPIKFFDDGALYISLIGNGREAVITNSESSFKNNTRYYCDVVEDGDYSIINNYTGRTYNVMSYSIVDTWQDRQTVQKHQNKINEYLAEQSEVKDKINQVETIKNNAHDSAGKLMNDVLEQLNNVTPASIVNFSKDKKSIPNLDGELV